MKRSLLLVLFLSGCSRPADVFEVETGGAQVAAATLSVCGKATPLEEKGAAFVGSHVISCEGSGVINVRTDSGGQVRCEMSYVTVQPPTGGDGFSHRFKIQGEQCLASTSIPVREAGGVSLSEKAANECGIKNVRRHVRPSGEVELGYFSDEQAPAAAECIWRWSERQLNG